MSVLLGPSDLDPLTAKKKVYKEWRADGNSKMEFSEEKGALNFDLRLWKSKGRVGGHAIYAPVVMKKV